jgi:hypothetical protein
MDMELVPDGIGPLLRSALAAGSGVVTTASAGVYTHVFTPGNTTPTFTFEASLADILIQRYGGIRVNTLEIGATFGEIVTGSWGLDGTTRSTTGTLANETYTNIGDAFHFDGALINKGTVGTVAATSLASVKMFSFSVGNNIDRVGTLRRTRNWRRTRLGMRDVGLSMTLDFDSADQYNEFLNETEFSIQLDLEAGFVVGTSGARDKLTIDIPRVRWNSLGVPLSAGDMLEESAECLILRPTNGDPIMTVTLVNGEATIPGAVA